ncbi:MAG: ATP-binding protein [Verrucomicrobiota bacterium]
MRLRTHLALLFTSSALAGLSAIGLISTSWSSSAFIGAILIVISANLVLALAFQNLLAKPLADLTQQAEDRALNRERFTPLESGPIEFRDLSNSLESIYSSLEEEAARRAQQLKIAADKARKAEITKGEFLAAISHEIRTPMNGIIGMNHLLLQADLPQKLKGYSETIHSSAETLLVLLNDILDFSKIESGKLSIEEERFDVRSEVEKAVDSLAIKAQDKNLDFHCHLPIDIPSYLIGDSHRIKQVLNNIVSNAIKFTENGKIEISVSKEQDTVEATRLRFEIADTGIGIEETTQKKLFTPFTQADASTTRKFGGTGLGLSICKKLVELMGGEIGLESAKDRGSTFWFTVHLLKDQRTPQDTSISDCGRALFGKKALIIDASESSTKWIQSWLELSGCECQSATDPLVGAKRLVETGAHWDIVIAEHETIEECIELYEMAYHEALAQKEFHSVLLTKLSVRPSQKTLEATQAKNLVEKPIKPFSLMQALNTCVFENPYETKKSSEPTKENRLDDASKLSILLADDNPTNREVSSALLERHHVNPDLAYDGKEAVEATLAKKYDLILMDCMMPELDGYQATRKIRADKANPNRETPIVALTANALAEDRDKCLIAGMDDYLSKPLNPHQLEELLSKRIYSSCQLDLEVEDVPIALIGEEDSNPTEPQILNMQVIQSFFGDDKETISSLFGVFKESVAEQIASFEAAQERNQDFEGMRFHAHSLKGSACNYGAERLQRIANELENACKFSDGPIADTLYRRLLDERELVDQQIAQLGFN